MEIEFNSFIKSWNRCNHIHSCNGSVFDHCFQEGLACHGLWIIICKAICTQVGEMSLLINDLLKRFK